MISASDTTMTRLTLKQIYLMDVHLRQTVAVKELRRLSPNTRKCYFRDEHPFQPYFWNYTPNMCKKYQRLKAAARLCQCVPFFYNISKFGFILINEINSLSTLQAHRKRPFVRQLVLSVSQERNGIIQATHAIACLCVNSVIIYFYRLSIT